MQRNYLVSLYIRDELRCEHTVLSEDIHEDVYDMIFDTVYESNPDDTMQTPNKVLIDKLYSAVEFDEHGFFAALKDDTVFEDVSIIAKRI